MAGEFVRHQARFCVSLPVRVRYRKQTQESPFGPKKSWSVEDTFTENMSLEGCYFFLSDQPHLGTVVEMAIQFPATGSVPGGARVHCHGKVIRIEDGCRGRKVGIAATIEKYFFVHAGETAQMEGALHAEW